MDSTTYIDTLKDANIRESFKHLLQNAQGNVIILTAAPTASAPLLRDNEIGIYSNSLYQRKGSTIYVYASDSQITI